MSSNSQTILGQLIEQEKQATAPEMGMSEFFELFTVGQILKNYGLSYDEIQSGIVDGGNDGGIDAIYTFANGVLATEDTDFSGIRQNARITLTIIQAKVTSGFSDEPILRLESTVSDLLNISNNLQNYACAYNPQLLRAFRIFCDAYKAFLAFPPELEIIFYYATQGDHIHPNVQQKAENLKSSVQRIFSESKPQFHFIDAEQLLKLYRKSKVETLLLNVAEALTTASSGTICLVRLKDFYDFICDSDNNELRSWLFEENVRDYEGKNIDVNKGIRQTLELPVKGQDFWWLNNGITVVAARAPLSGKVLSVTDPKIVNGLQTSIEMYNFFWQYPDLEDNRTILVRVIVTTDDKTRNDIIRATNSQSAIKAASLRAFDPIHYKIEQHFLLNGLFYERRKNYYKNQGKPKNQIISIQYVAQAVAAILLQRPNDSRGRPINLIKNRSHYDRIFNESYPIEVYHECVRFMMAIENYLSSDNVPEYIKGHEVNVRYHLAMFASAMKAERLTLTPRYIQKNSLGLPTTDHLTKCLKHVWEILQSQRGIDKDRDEDRVAKSPDFDATLKERLRQILIDKTVQC